jgi:hypothetical protein
MKKIIIISALMIASLSFLMCAGTVDTTDSCSPVGSTRCSGNDIQVCTTSGSCPHPFWDLKTACWTSGKTCSEINVGGVISAMCL